MDNPAENVMLGHGSTMTSQAQTQTQTQTQTAANPTILRCTSSADFLASLPVLLGYTVENSIVLSLFQGSRVKSAARIDLPAEGVPFAETMLDEAIIGTVSQCTWVTSVAITIFTDRAFADEGRIPHQPLALWLERRLEEAGIAIIEMSCIATDAWAEYRSEEARGLGRDLSEVLAPDQLAKEHGLPKPELGTIDDLAALPLADASLTALLEAEIRASPVIAASDLTPERFEEILTACSTVLHRGVTAKTLPLCAVLVRTAQQHSTWIIPVIIISSGTGDVITQLTPEVRDAFLAFVLDPKTGAQYGGIPMAQRLLMFSSERLPHPFLRQAASILQTLTAHTPDEYRASLYALLAWLWWMAGLMSPALKHLEQADRLHPTHPIVETVTQALSQGPALWVYGADE